MEAFLNSAAVVGFGEMGDKTQVLALLLAMRYRRSLPILTGIFFATLVSMGVTALLGTTPRVRTGHERRDLGRNDRDCTGRAAR